MAISVMLSGNISKEIIIIKKCVLKDLKETNGREIKYNPRINDCVMNNISMHLEFVK